MGSDSFGQFFKTKRIEKGFTLRKFCHKYGLDPGNISKLERGVLPPPASREKLNQYACCLEIKEGSEDWYEFFDLATVGRGRIPKEIMGEKELVKKLPLICRTLKREKVTDEEQINRLITLIKETWKASE